MRAADVRRRSTPSSPPQSSTTSIHRLGSPTCWPACRIIPPGASTNSCLGTGALRASRTPPERNRLSAQSDLTRGRRRMRTEIQNQTGVESIDVLGETLVWIDGAIDVSLAYPIPPSYRQSACVWKRGRLTYE